MNKNKFIYITVITVIIITSLGCGHTPRLDFHKGDTSKETTIEFPTIGTNATAKPPPSSSTITSKNQKVGTAKGNTVPEFYIQMNDGITRTFPASLTGDNPVFLLFFTLH